MTNDGLGMLPRFAQAIKNLPEDNLSNADLSQLLIADALPIQIYYAPFDWINKSARVVICGITPGRHSMENALMAARSALLENKTLEQASEMGKRTGSFSNMRKTLAAMLDELGLNAVLGIDSTASLFGADGKNRHLLQATSCIRYPVFVNGKNYTGHSPKMLKSPVLVRFIESVLGVELNSIPNALVVPCGEAVDEVLRQLVANGIIDERRCLMGFPHASGANGHRKRFFEERKTALSEKIKIWSNSIGH